MALPDQRPVFAREHITSYLDRLKLPHPRRCYDAAALSPDEALSYLALLQTRHLAEVPFENLSLHYSPDRRISLQLDDVFAKVIAARNGRGGYCMENNLLFGTLLRSLGFTVYPAGARVAHDGRFSGWGHMINIVGIGTARYHVDVGFGGNGPVVPMPLDRSGLLQPNVAPASARLQWKNIPDNTDATQRLWVYEHRLGDDAEFEMVYCFTELEFLPGDYQVLNYYTSTSPSIFFTQVIVGVKMIAGEDGELIGSLILGNNDIKWRIHGKKTRQIDFESEQDRLEAIEEHFGIRLTAADKEGIRGLASEIKRVSA